jgi:hypothetical protein
VKTRISCLVTLDKAAGGLLLANEYSLLIKRTADPSASLGMTKGDGCASVWRGGTRENLTDVV